MIINSALEFELDRQNRIDFQECKLHDLRQPKVPMVQWNRTLKLYTLALAPNCRRK